jgi:hypothetical protein
MARLKRIIAVLVVLGALMSAAPVVYADAGGGPGGNHGCPGHQPTATS